jgi:hypothetical protein
VNPRVASRNELDGMVVNVELTLSSIVQGVALSVLADNARTVLSAGRAIAWPYVIAGLLVILLFWSRSLIHTLTLIRWPLEFGHNCLYIACALVAVLAFTRITEPFSWFVLLAVFSASVWVIFVYDLRMIRLRMSECTTANSCELYDIVLRDQRLNIRLIVPAVFAFNFGRCLRNSRGAGFLSRAPWPFALHLDRSSRPSALPWVHHPLVYQHDSADCRHT